jgi:ribosomal-protein-alanine N-acetyltransferase
MPFGPRLVGERVVLRPAAAADVAARAGLGRHAEILRMFGATEPESPSMTRDEAEAWVAARGADGVVEWIVDAEGRFLGAARLHSFDRAGGAKYAIGLLDPDRLGKGFGTEATRLVLDYAFGQLGLERVTVAVLEFNHRAMRCYRRCGFRPTGRVVGAAVVDGESYDDIVMEVRREHDGA